MKKLDNSAILTQLREEERHSVTGIVPPVHGLDGHIYQYFYKNWDVNLAYAHIELGNHDLNFLKLRIQLFKGEFDQANNIIAAIKHEQTDPHIVTELLFEQARSLAFEGNWGQAYKLTEEALSIAPIGVTRLSLLQVKSLCAFELGLFTDCTKDLSLATSLKTIFKDTISGFYLDILKLKLLVREACSVDMVFHIKQFIANPENKISDMNKLSSLLRLIVDVKRVKLIKHFNSALANLVVHEKLDEKLYVDLAKVDLCLTSNNLQQDESIINELKKSYFKRVQLLIEESALKTSQVSTTGLSLAHWLQNYKFKNANIISEREKYDQRSVLTSIHIPELSLIFKINTWQVLELTPLENKILTFIESSPSKEELFHQAWGLNPYRPHQHDALIWNGISKLRKKTGLKISMQGMNISCLELLQVRVESDD